MELDQIRHTSRTSAKAKRNGNGSGGRVKRWLATLGIGAIGGLLGFVAREWWIGYDFAGTGGDAISIANTFIVFTTLLVTVAAIVITVVGVVMSLDISKSKVTQSREAFDFLCEQIGKDEVQATELLNAMLDNPDVQRQIEAEIRAAVENKVKEVAEEKQADAEAKEKVAKDARQQAENATQLASRIVQHEPPRPGA